LKSIFSDFTNKIRVVIESGYLWLIQVYDPTGEASEKAAPLWEEFCILKYVNC